MPCKQKIRQTPKYINQRAILFKMQAIQETGATLRTSLAERELVTEIIPTDHRENTYRSTLIENVVNHAIKAISRTDASAFWRPQIGSFLGAISRLISESVQEPFAVDSDSNAKLRFAESKTIKKISSRISLALADGERRPSGFDVYSSTVIYTK